VTERYPGAKLCSNALRVQQVPNFPVGTEMQNPRAAMFVGLVRAGVVQRERVMDGGVAYTQGTGDCVAGIKRFGRESTAGPGCTPAGDSVRKEAAVSSPPAPRASVARHRGSADR
jgi:hypothetical protein